MERPNLKSLVAKLEEEDAPDPRSLLHAHVAHHHDRAIGAFLDACSLEALHLLLGRAQDPTLVRRPGAVGPVMGGYGKAAGAIKVRDKVAFALRLMLGEMADEALSQGPGWVQKHAQRLQSDGQRFHLN